MQPNQPQDTEQQDLGPRPNEMPNIEPINNDQQPINNPVAIVEQPEIIPQDDTKNSEVAQPDSNEQFFAASPVVEPLSSTVETQASNYAETAESDKLPVSTAVPPKKSKKIFIIVMISLILTMLSGGTVLAYNLWYSNPNKVMSDAIVNAITAKSINYTGDLKISSEGSSLSISFSAAQNRASGKLDATLTISFAGINYVVDTSALIDDNGDIYFKADKLAVVADQIASLGIDRTEIDSFVEKINNKWIKVANSDFASYSEAKECVTSTISKFKDDKLALDEITNIYNTYQFINIDKQLGKKDGSFGYIIKADTDAAKLFLENVKTTKFYIALKDCDENFDISSDDISFGEENASEISNEVWIDSWSHNITKVVVAGKLNETSLSATINTSFGKLVTVDTPKESIDFKDVLSDLFGIMANTGGDDAISDKYDTAQLEEVPDLSCETSITNEDGSISCI